jgi:hypothetical protein
MKDFFISYNKTDKTWAEWIAWILEEAGYSVIFQAWDFRPGKNFVLEMQRATNETHKTIILLSENYLNAIYTQPEWAAAFVDDPLGKKQKLIPIRVKECRPTGMLASLIYIDIVGLREHDAKLAILSGFGMRAKPENRPKFPSDTSSNSFLATVNATIPYPGHSKLLDQENVQDNLTINYELIPVENKSDLEKLHTFCEEIVGPHFASLEQWRDRYEKNPDTFFKILKIKRTKFEIKEELTGMFTIIPVNEIARTLLEQDQLNATTFTTEHIVSSGEEIAAVYISGVVGSTQRAKGYVISHLLNRLRQIHKKGINLIYTRPMTIDGLRLAKYYGFNPVKADLSQAEHIHKRNMLDGPLR